MGVLFPTSCAANAPTLSQFQYLCSALPDAVPWSLGQLLLALTALAGARLGGKAFGAHGCNRRRTTQQAGLKGADDAAASKPMAQLQMPFFKVVAPRDPDEGLAVVFRSLRPGSSYSFKMRARNAYGYGPWSQGSEFVHVPAAGS